jgi:hypothetical protein
MVRMTWRETGFVTLNAALLAIFYTLLGVFVSFILYYLFDEFNEELMQLLESKDKLYSISKETDKNHKKFVEIKKEIEELVKVQRF